MRAASRQNAASCISTLCTAKFAAATPPPCGVSLPAGTTDSNLRQDGWPGLLKADGLAKAAPSGLGHGTAYEALAAGRIDVLDLYSADARIARYRIRVLADGRHYCPRDTLCFIELPLARLVILAGIKTSAVINVGTATMAAFIGAGGYGERIAAGLALVIQGVFGLLERRVVPGR